jgi:hypothetical protein
LCSRKRIYDPLSKIGRKQVLAILYKLEVQCKKQVIKNYTMVIFKKHEAKLPSLMGF